MHHLPPPHPARLQQINTLVPLNPTCAATTTTTLAPKRSSAIVQKNARPAPSLYHPNQLRPNCVGQPRLSQARRLATRRLVPLRTRREPSLLLRQRARSARTAQSLLDQSATMPRWTMRSRTTRLVRQPRVPRRIQGRREKVRQRAQDAKSSPPPP
ncbi:hypothetical protein RSOL_138560 [Rhizoctonia solani AG-3 Rhs1AP]|uniref:Uncharacterized protein n=1 Tax=Rhizoctonia solani AG-3 Rhs1AP TaxID=1086054 RepID=X8J1C8_9AGAM|nr:hypothetical protein RSOL_138560 [Rhizoctonia solani AG-3 Rhs1AP]